MKPLFDLLDRLPLNGYKTALGTAAYVVVVGLWGIGHFDSDTTVMLLTAVSAWTGVSLAHKVDKAKREE